MDLSFTKRNNSDLQSKNAIWEKRRNFQIIFLCVSVDDKNDIVIYNETLKI